MALLLAEEAQEPVTIDAFKNAPMGFSLVEDTHETAKVTEHPWAAYWPEALKKQPNKFSLAPLGSLLPFFCQP